MGNQVVIKVILIALFVAFALVLIVPVSGARRLAVRRVLLLLTTIAGILAIAFPELLNALANLVGVGRGTDLVLYVLVVVFVGNAISNSISHRQLEREVTKLARTAAITAAPPPQRPTVTDEGKQQGTLPP